MNAEKKKNILLSRRGNGRRAGRRKDRSAAGMTLESDLRSIKTSYRRFFLPSFTYLSSLQ